MQEARAPAPRLTAMASPDDVGDVRRTVEEKPVVVVGRRGCCMVHVARRLLLGQGANPAVLEVGDDADPVALVVSLRSSKDNDGAKGGLNFGVADAYGAAPVATTASAARHAAFPAVFIGGRLVGGLDRLMAMHIAGELVPVLKQAGALWL
jgi:glutaredoxin